MNVKILLIFTLSIFGATSACDQWMFSCARHFFREYKIVNFVFVNSPESEPDQLSIDAFYKSMHTEYDWSFSVVSDIFGAMDVQKNEIAKNVILFTSSPTDIGPVYANIHLINTRVFIIVTNTSPDCIQSIFQKFNTSMRSHVYVMERIGDDFWKFHEYADNRCITNGTKSPIIVAECNDSSIDMGLRYSSKDSQVKEKSCPLIVVTRQFEPFTYHDDVKGFHNGIDYIMVKTISERLRVNVKFIRAGNGTTIDLKMIE